MDWERPTPVGVVRATTSIASADEEECVIMTPSPAPTRTRRLIVHVELTLACRSLGRWGLSRVRGVEESSYGGQGAATIHVPIFNCHSGAMEFVIET